MKPFDLHCHTNMSDGTDSPAELVQNAALAGLSMLAVTDHDCVAGVEEAVSAAPRFGIAVVPGIELAARYDTDLHILGLGIDVYNTSLLQAIEYAASKREERNSRVIDKLLSIGIDIVPFIEEAPGLITRLHLAKALVAGGFVNTSAEAFDRYLSRNRSCFVPCERLTKEDAVSVIHGAGGIAVLAHPCKLKCDYVPLIHDLAALGLDGIEAYYPTSTDGQRTTFLSLAAQLGLMASSGSDYHGKNRSTSPLGIAFSDVPALQPIYDLLMSRFGK